MKKIIAFVLVLVLCLTTLCACAPKEEDLKKTYSDAGYACISINAATMSKYDIDSGEVEYGFVATKLVSNIVVVCFKNINAANDYIKKSELKSGEYKQKGAAIAFGDEDALKLF